MARRPYGSGSLLARSDRRGGETWYGLWMVGGRRVKRRIGPKRTEGSGKTGLTRRQAEAELRRLMAEAPTAVAGETRRTVAEAGEAYVNHLEDVMQRKRTTIQDYRGYLSGHLEPHFGNRTIDKIEPEHVEAYLHVKLRKGLSSKTVGNHLTFLHGLFSFAVRRRWVEANPVAMVDRPRHGGPAQRRIRFLQPVEVEAVLRAVPSDDLGLIERPLYLCAVMAGLRQGELLALRWPDVDWTARRVRVADNLPHGRSDRVDSPKSHYLRST